MAGQIFDVNYYALPGTFEQALGTMCNLKGARRLVEP